MTVGAATYLAFSAVSNVIFGVVVVTSKVLYGRTAAWPLLLAGALIGLAVALTWASSRWDVLVVAVIVAAGAVCLTRNWQSGYGWPIPELGCLAALLARGDRQPGRGWLWPVVLVAAWLLVAYLVPVLGGGWAPPFLVAFEAMGVISLPWAVIDARPAVAVAVFLLALWLPLGISSLVPFEIGALLPLLIVIPLAGLAVWLLRRQSASIPAPHGS